MINKFAFEDESEKIRSILKRKRTQSYYVLINSNYVSIVGRLIAP